MPDGVINTEGSQPVPQERESVVPKIEIAARSLASEKHPGSNQDSLFRLPDGSFGVFDGVGGGPKGDVMSGMARDYIGNKFQEKPSDMTEQEATDFVRKSLLDANEELFRYAEEVKNRMSTTASVGVIIEAKDRKRKLVLGNVGDSRVYRLRGGRLEQITLDDGFVRDSGKTEQENRALQYKFNNTTDPATQLTVEEQMLFEKRNIIFKALGKSAHSEPRIHTVDLKSFDRLLVCSDGISDNLTDLEMEAILNNSQTADEALQRLMDSSTTRSKDGSYRSKADDMTAIVLDIKGGQEAKSQIVLKEAENQTTKTEEISAPPPAFQEIQGSQTVDELLDVLDELGGIMGPKGLYKSEQLNQLIPDVIAGKRPIEEITRAGGLRETVIRLKELKDVREKLKTSN
jgi:protein phosphatase